MHDKSLLIFDILYGALVTATAIAIQSALQSGNYLGLLLLLPLGVVTVFYIDALKRFSKEE